MSDEEGGGVQRIGKAIAQGAVAGAIAASSSGAEVALVGAGLGGAAGGAKEMIGLAVEHLSSNAADRRLFQVNEQLQAQALDEHRERIEERLEELRQAVGDREAASTVVPALQDWSRAWASADGKKQRVIMAALVSTFDPDSHEQAMSRTFFRLLEALDYPEIHFLCSIYRQIPADRFGTWYGTDDLEYGSRGWYLVQALEEHGLVLLSSSSTKQFGATWLGQEFAAFLQRGDFLPAVPESDGDEQSADEGDPERESK